MSEEIKKDYEVIVDEVISQNPDKVNNYKLGKKGLIGWFMGETMKVLKGHNEVEAIHDYVKSELEKS